MLVRRMLCTVAGLHNPSGRFAPAENRTAVPWSSTRLRVTVQTELSQIPLGHRTRVIGLLVTLYNLGNLLG